MFYSGLTHCTDVYNHSTVLIPTETEKLVTEEIRAPRTTLVKVTAYAPHDNKSRMCRDSDILTATGTVPKHGTLATNCYTYGESVYIPGYGVGTAEDTGGALRNYDGNAVDVYMETYDQAIKWGVKYVRCVKGE